MAKTSKDDVKKAAKKDPKHLAKASKHGLSEDKIVNSDSETEAVTKSSKNASVSTKTKSKKTHKEPPPKAPSPTSNSEEDSEESTESEDEKDVPASKPLSATAKTNGMKRKAEEQRTSSSEDTSTDSEESLAEDKPKVKKAKTESSSGLEEETKEAVDHTARASTATGALSRAPAVQASVSSIPAKPFQTPRDFTNLSTASAKSLLPSTRSLAGKQIWHISAPSNVPISSISEVALSAVASGATVLTHKGIEYSLTQAKTTLGQGDNVLVPSDSGYELLDQPIHTSLILQQKIVLPNLTQKQADLNTGSAAAADVSRAAFSTARPQPKGMRMRYKPPGFGQGQPGLGSGSEDDGEGEGEASSFQFPKTKGFSTAPPSAEKKKKRTASGEGEMSKEERKRLKKEAKAKAKAA